MAINFRSNTIIKNLRVGPLSGGGNGGGGGGGSISTTGLQLYWDLGNSTSYSGTGTTITDLSGNGNDGILTGTPTYSSAGASSYLDWSGDNTAFATYNSNLYDDTLNVQSADEVTVSNWVTFTDGHPTLQNTYIGSCQNGDITLRQFYDDDSHPLHDRIIFILSLNNNVNYHYSGTDSSTQWQPYSSYGLSTSDFGNWFNFTVTAGAGYYRVYVNGIEQWNNTYDTNYSIENYKFVFGGMLETDQSTRRTWSGFSGKWGNSAVYNRALPASEVLSNFDALKSRYGY